jgi:hypothetical protein
MLRGWLALTVALSLVAIAIYGFLTVEQQKHDYAALVQNVQKNAQLVAQSSRLHGLMNDTKDDRVTLQGIISADLVGLVDAVDAVGKVAGLNLQISNVQPEAQKKGTPAGTPIPVNFVVQADGTFAQLDRLVELLNSFPIPSIIQQLDLNGSGSSWHMTAHIHVLTVSETSS